MENVASIPDIDEVSSMMKTESRFFMGIERSEIQILTEVLENLNNFLTEADSKSIEKLTRESVKSWLEQTKEDSEKVNAYLEENCLLKLSKILQEQRLVNFLSQAGQRFGKLNEIRKLTEIGQKNKEEKEAKKSPYRKLVYSFVDEYVDTSENDVMNWLTEEEPKSSVLSIIGPIGNTSLAKKVYENESVRDRFDFCFWVNARGLYKIDDLRNVIADRILHNKENDVRTIDLIEALNQFLEPKRYFFVFDDVSHIEFWNIMKNSLPDNDKGSRIFITITSDEILDPFKEEASFDRFHELRPLFDSESWEVFRPIAFQDEPGFHFPRESEILFGEIIETSKSFPLPIVGVTELFSKIEKLVSEWHKGFDLEVETGIYARHVLDALALSFYDLPDHLRPCFLYFSIFPRDFLIPSEKLLKLWIAEGFVRGRNGMTLEEVAEEYLNELIGRDLVRISRAFYGFDRFCQVDRLIHNIACTKAEKLNFSSVWEGKSSSFRSKSNRLSVYNVENLLHAIEDYQTRSVFLLKVRSLRASFLTDLSRNCDFLTLLDFEDCPIKIVPEELGNLFRLKYLGLKNTLVSGLPKSLPKLQNLETLNLRNTRLDELPNEIKYLENLRHLSATFSFGEAVGDSNKGVRVNKGIDRLESLQTLTTIDASHKGIRVLREVSRLRELRKLGISGLTRELSSSLNACLDELIHLESITLQAANENEILNLERFSSSVPLLKRLVLKCRLAKLPEGISRLENLTVLCLSLSRLTEDPIKQLSQLPNLSSLWLYRAYEGEKLCFEKGGFERLKLLVIRDLNRLNALEIEDGALNVLEELRIGSNHSLNEVPIGIFHLRSLKVLASYDMPREFVLGMNPDEGSDYWKVEHVSSVLFWYRVEGNNYKLFKLGDPELLDHLRGLETNTNVIEHDRIELESSFCDSDEKEDEVPELSFSTRSSSRRSFSKQWSFSSGFYTDDVEE